MLPRLNKINHGDREIRIADFALPGGIHRQHIACQLVFARAFTLRVKHQGRAQVRPGNIVADAQRIIRLRHRGSQRFEFFGHSGRVYKPLICGRVGV